MALFFVFVVTSVGAIPGAENGEDCEVVKNEHSTKYRKSSNYIKSVSRRLRQLPEFLYDIICNDYFGHHLHSINVHILQHAIKMQYDAINVAIAGKNGTIVYNTDVDGLVCAVLQRSVLFNDIVALIDTVQSYDARIIRIDEGDLL